MVGRYSIPQRWYAAKAKMLGVDQLDDWDRYASVADRHGRVRRGTTGASIVGDAYRSFSPDMADVVEQFLSRAVDRRAGAPGQAWRRVLCLHGAVAPPVPDAELDVDSAATC